MLRTLSMLLAAALLACPAPADATTVAALSGAIRDARARSRTLAGRGWSNSAEEALVGRIDGLADDFHDLAADGASMQKTSAALVELIEEMRKRYTDVLEKLQADVIRIDGDLEAVQDSDAWQQREVLAMRLLYRLNWVRYERAMRYEAETGRRKRLLVGAQGGFAEFLGSGDRALTVETLLGHGLTSKALKQYDTALADFAAALDTGADPAMAARIRIAMAEVHLSTKRTGDALAVTERLLRSTTGNKALAASHTQALFLRAKALLVALGANGAYSQSQRAKFRAEAARALEGLYDRGDYWKAKVVQLVDAGISDPHDWTSLAASEFVTWLLADSLRRRAEYDQAIALYDGLLAGDRFRNEALYGLGSCYFHERDYERALGNLTQYLEDAPATDPSYPEAAYLRFKASESLYLKAEAAARNDAATRYRQAMEDFLADAPSHRYAFEAWFRLGEWHRERSEYRECGEAFAKVAGDAAFEIKAGFLSAQCWVEAVLVYPESETPPLELVRTAVESLDGFSSFAAHHRSEHPAGEAELLAPLEAKTVVMAAAVVTRAGAGTMQDRLARLRDFEQRFPAERDLLPEVLSLRIVAHRSTGDLDLAGTELEGLLNLDVPGAYRHDSLKKLGIVFMKEAARRDEAGDGDGAMRSRRVALRVYRTLLDDSRAGSADADDAAVIGLEKLVADLSTQVGDN